jgi:hypothetical protein
VGTGDAAAGLALLDDGEADLAVAALPSRIPATLLARTVARPLSSSSEPIHHDQTLSFRLRRAGR